MMNKEKLSQIFEEYGTCSECANDKNNHSWSDIIHYPTQREQFLLNGSSDYLDFIHYMRAECIKNSVFSVPMTSEKEYYRSYEHERGPIPLFSTQEEAELAHEKYGMPAFANCEERTLLELIGSLDMSDEVVVNPATECKFMKIGYYEDCLLQAENVTEQRFLEIVKKRKLRGDFW